MFVVDHGVDPATGKRHLVKRRGLRTRTIPSLSVAATSVSATATQPDQRCGPWAATSILRGA